MLLKQEKLVLSFLEFIPNNKIYWMQSFLIIFYFYINFTSKNSFIKNSL